MRLIRNIVMFFTVSIVVISIYAFKIEPKLVKVNEISLGTTNGELVKVVQLSDIQVSKGYSMDRLDKIVDKVNNENPDVIVFTGDLFDNYAEYGPTEEMIESLSRMNSSIGKYAVWGNHDYGGGASRIYETVMTSSGFKVLRNEGETISLENSKQLFIGGLDDSLLGNPSIDTLLTYRNNYDYSILLTHEPDIADSFIDTNTQLILAGHSHGGQVNIPFLEPEKTLLAEKYTSGMYELENDTKLYVNTGLGTTKIHARFNVIPEITVFNITI